MAEKNPEPINGKVENILATIAADFRRALEAERAFVEWERANRSAQFSEFTKRFVEWVDASEAYVSKYHTIEEHFPAFSDKMHDALRPVRREF